MFVVSKTRHLILLLTIEVASRNVFVPNGLFRPCLTFKVSNAYTGIRTRVVSCVICLYLGVADARFHVSSDRKVIGSGLWQVC